MAECLVTLAGNLGYPALVINPKGQRSESSHSHKQFKNMLKEERARRELEAQRYCLYEELRRMAATMDLHSLERLCRQINVIMIKIHSFKGGLYDKE